jgi:DNA repair exonuclease SbcCD ATPase subunit
MKIEFDLLDINGFRTFVNPTEFDFYKIGPGLHFLRGENGFNPRLESNGAGKSSIWGALSWALFGKTVGGLNRNDIKPWFSKASPSVYLELYIDGKKHLVLRDAKELRVDGKPAPQEKVDALIGMNFDIFTHTILLGQGRPLFFDLSPAAKLDLFTAVLNLERWDDYSEKARTRAREMGEERAGLVSKADALDTERSRIADNIQTLSDQSKDWEDERAKKKAEVKESLGKLRSQLETVEKNHDEATLALDSAGTELKQVKRDIPKAEKIVREFQRKVDKINADADAAQERVEEIQAELRDLGKGDRCPVCGQSLKGTKLQKHKEELLDRLDDMEEKAKGKIPSKLSDDLAVAKRTLALLEASRDAFEEKAEKAQVEVDYCSPRVAELKASIQAIKATQAERSEEANPYLEQKRSLEKRLRTIAGEIKRADEEAELAERRRSRAQFWVKGFKEVKLFQVEECLHELEIATNALLDDAGLIDWQVRYAVEKETKSKTIKRGLNVMILSPDNDKEVKWEVWSGGEGQRLRLCGALALSEVLLNYAGITPSLEILDEPSTFITRLGIQDMCGFLADRAQTLDRQIFLVDQHVTEQEAFASIISVIRDREGASRIVLGSMN